MASVFTNIAAPAANGSSAAVDFSSYSALKCIIVSGSWPDASQPAINIEINNDAVPNGSWSPLCTFQGAGMKTINCTARWMRATVSNYRGGQAPVVNVGGEDAGAQFAALPLPAPATSDGVGAAVDVSALGIFKTVTIGMPAGGPDDFSGSVVIEVSEDGNTEWAEAVTFDHPGQKSFELVARWARVRRRGISGNVSDPGSPIVSMGGSAVSVGGSINITGEGSFTSLDFTGAGVTVTDAGNGTATIDIPGGGGGGSTVQFFGTGVQGDSVAATPYTATDGLDEFWDDLTIPDNGEYRMNGMRLFVNGTLTLGANARLHYDGNAGVGQNQGSEGNSAGGVIGYGLAGGGGGNNAAGSAGAGTGTTSLGFPAYQGLWTAGAGGAAGANGGGAGGDTSGLSVTKRIPCYDIVSAVYGGGERFYLGWVSFNIIAGGPGGGGGAGSGGVGNIGGGGGGGGGVMVVFARNIVMGAGAVISARGGAGAAGTSAGGAAGGGGGGSGGVIFIASTSNIQALIDAGQISVAGGAGGAGAGGGANGTNGSAGAIIAFQL